MKRKAVIILSVVLAGVLLLAAWMSYFIGIQVFNGSTQLVTNESTVDVPENFWDEHHMDYNEFCNNYEIERIEITSSLDEHIIPADYIYAPLAKASKNNKTVILVHGLGGNRYTTYPYAQMFLDLGFNVIAYDQRSTNENTARFTTFGYLEKYDLIDCIDYVIDNAPGQTIGVWGISFGGATAGLAMGHEDTDEKVDFVILDCPVSSMEWFIKDELENMNMGIPTSYLVWSGNLINKMRLGFSYKDVEVSKAMKDVTTPVLIINSKADTLTPYFMGKDIFDGIRGNNKQIWTVEDSEHAYIWADYTEEYIKKVADFIE